MNQDICINNAKLIHKEDYILIKSEKGLLYLANSDKKIYNKLNNIIMHSLKEDAEKLKDIKENIIENSLIISSSSPAKNYSIETRKYVTAIVSASNLNLYGAGEIQRNKTQGSIHIILLIDKKLDHKNLIKIYSKALEAKVTALWDLDIRSASGDLASGNNNDLLIAACTESEDKKIDENELQYLTGKCVRDALKKSMLKNGFSKGIMDYIEELGIKIDDLVHAGMELCVGVEINMELHNKLRLQILKSLEDLNVVSFIIAGIRLEEDYAKHRIHGIDVDDDPAYLYSDEVLGMSIANQIAGTKAIFNFKRYDEEKPGIISELGPVLDDVFAGLVAGCMSKIFEE